MNALRQLVQLCIDLQEEQPNKNLDRILSRLQGPLRVAIAGRINSGKSTLVNALLEQLVAPVDNRECTRVVTWYTFAPFPSAYLIRRDGTRHKLEFDREGRVPSDLAVDLDEVERIDVTLSNKALRDLTIIDTPGLQTTSNDVARGAERVLGLDPSSTMAVKEADVTVYLMTHLKEADVELLRTHLGNVSPATSLGVLSKADRLAVGQGEQLAATFAEELRALLWDVVPVNGLAAETAQCGRLTETDASAMRRLHEQPEGDLRIQLLHAKRFVESGDRDERQRLLDLFDTTALQRAVEQQVSGTAADYCDWLFGESGFDRLSNTIRTLFTERSRVLKVASAVDDLKTLAFDSALTESQRERVVDELDILTKSDELHDVDEIELLRDVRRGRIRAQDPKLLDQLERLLSPGDALERLGLTLEPLATAADLAAQQAGQWRRLANSGLEPISMRRAAEVAERSCNRLWEALR